MFLYSLSPTFGTDVRADHRPEGILPSYPSVTFLCEIVTPLKNSIHGVNFHPELAPFVGSDLANKSLKWSKEPFRSTCIHTLQSQADPEYRGFHRDGREPPTLDIIHQGPQELSYLTISEFGGPTLETSYHNINPKNRLFELHTVAGRTICLGRRQVYGGSPLRGLSAGMMVNPDGSV